MSAITMWEFQVNHLVAEHAVMERLVKLFKQLKSVEFLIAHRHA